MPVRTRVMLIEDEMPVRQAYSLLLENDGRAIVVAEAEDQTEAVDRLLAMREADSDLARPSCALPDVIVLDMHIPERIGQPIRPQGGVELIPRLRELAPDVRILVSTQAVEDGPIINAFAAGADGYVWKNETGDAIATAVQRVAEGRLVATVSVAERVVGLLDELRAKDGVILPHKRRHKRLSDLLYRTMRLYCFDGLSAREIAEREFVGVDAVNSRIKKAFEILGASGRREAFRRLTELSEDTT